MKFSIIVPVYTAAVFVLKYFIRSIIKVHRQLVTVG